MGRSRRKHFPKNLSSRLALPIFIGLLVVPLTVHAQEKSVLCHVYVVDVVKARRSLDDFRETGNSEVDQRALNTGVTTFSEFSPTVGEEELTTKHYRFPGSRLFVTASIFFTDESLSSWPTGNYAGNSNSAELGIMLAPAKRPSAFTFPPFSGAMTEVTLDEYTNNVRVKQYVRVKGRTYLIGVQCDFMAEKRGK
jgi:hypothetical protein